MIFNETTLDLLDDLAALPTGQFIGLIREITGCEPGRFHELNAIKWAMNERVPRFFRVENITTPEVTYLIKAVKILRENLMDGNGETLSLPTAKDVALGNWVLSFNSDMTWETFVQDMTETGYLPVACNGPAGAP